MMTVKTRHHRLKWDLARFKAKDPLMIYNGASTLGFTVIMSIMGILVL